MALKRGLSGVHTIRGGGGGGSRSALVLLVFFFVFAPLVFIGGRGNLDWRDRLAIQSVRSLFSKEILDVITTNTADLGPFSLDSFKKKKFSASWREVGADTSFRNSENQSTSTITNAKRDVLQKQLREERREMRANDLVQHNDDTILKLDDAAIERSKSVDSAVLGKYSIWRRENENDNSDSNICLMRDQVIIARVYSGIAKLKNKNNFVTRTPGPA